MTSHARLGELLVADGRVQPEQVDRALEIQAQQKRRQPIGAILLELGAIDHLALARALAAQTGALLVDPTHLPVDPAVLWKVPRKLAEQYRAFAHARDGRTFVVAVTEPNNANLRRDLEFLLGGPVRLETAAEPALLAAVHRHYDLEPVAQRMLAGVPPELRAPVTAPTSLDLDAPAIEARLGRGGSAYVDLVNFLLVNAIERGASDIHLEPQREGLRVRFRVDGMLREVLRLPSWAVLPLTNRVKIVADLDIGERRRAQDGRSLAELGERRIDLRVSTVPNQYGENIVIRILDSRTVKTELGALGWQPRQLAACFSLLSQPQGIVLVTGPTGSGKSTTLYAAINRLMRESTSIVSIEDPIEHSIAGITQIQVNADTGATFATLIRSVLRQDPNVMVIGEMRDAESAAAALDAATTGHLVLSTLHAGNAIRAITRLRELGLPDALVSSALLGVVAQRLVRCVCGVCSELVEASPEEWERLELPEEPLGMLARRVGAGCPSCQYSGYRGRVGVFEVLKIEATIRDAVARGAGEREIHELAARQGHLTMLDDAIDKCRLGVTTLEEVARVVPTEPWREANAKTPRAAAPHPAAAAPTPAPEPPVAAPPPGAVGVPALATAPVVAAEASVAAAAPTSPTPAAAALPPAPHRPSAPARAAADSSGVVAPAFRTVRAPPDPGRPRVLVVDDAEEILSLVGATLEDDYAVLYARDGEAALLAVEAERPDAIVLDVMMPKLSGYEVCRRLKDDPSTERIPILILSARGDAAHVKEGFHSGADDYLPKPFDPEELELRLRALLRRAGRLAARG